MTTPTTPARHRPCMTCRLRHVLCDRQRPCGRCVRLGETDHCEDPPHAHKRGRPRKEPPPPPHPLPAPYTTTTTAAMAPFPQHPAPVPTNHNSIHEEGEEGHHDFSRQGVEGRGGSAPPLGTTLSLALLVELKKVRRECATMAGKLDRVAKRQKLTQGQLDTKMITSPSSSPSSFTSTSPSTSSSSPPPRLFADWLKGVRLSTATSAHIHVRVLSSRPSSNLLSCLADQPWLIERVVPLSELCLPKHRFPAGIEPYLSAGLRPGQKVPATLVTGFNDQCCNLFKYSREELEGLNALRLYPRSIWEVLPAIAEVVFSKWPTTDGPVYHFTTPMIDKQGGILCTECRWQGFYDLQGNFSWGVTVVDRWSGPFINHLEHHQQPPEPVEEAAPTSQPHHNPTNFVDHPPTLDDLLYSHFFQDDPPT